MLELKDASLTIGGRQILNKLSLMAHDGQVTCITGAQGCGKTLVLKVMMGFVQLDEGLVSVDGELVTALSAYAFRRKMAYVPQMTDRTLENGRRQAAFVPTTDDMETVWSGEPLPAWEPKAIEQPVVTVQDKAIVLADNPPVAMLGQLRSLANEGRTVVVASCEETFLNMSDKIITLGEHDHIFS